MAQTARVSKLVRKTFGGKAVEPNAMRDLRLSTHTEDEYFELRTLTFLTSSGKGFEQEVAIVRDLQSYVAHIHQMRNLVYQETFLKIGVDHGGSSLKFSLSVIPNNYLHGRNECSGDANPNGIKRVILLAVGTLTLVLQNLSIDSILLSLISAPNTPENYYNLFLLWNALDLNSLKFFLCCDLKVANLVLGLQSHASMFPCHFCESKNKLEGDGKQWTLGKERSLGSIQSNAISWSNAGSVKKNASSFFNCIKVPLFDGPSSTLVHDLIPPPELHLLIGNIN